MRWLILPGEGGYGEGGGLFIIVYSIKQSLWQCIGLFSLTDYVNMVVTVALSRLEITRPD